MSESIETRLVPLWVLREMADTLRMVSNAIDSPKRESCLDRNVMRSWNHVINIINEHTPTIDESIGYHNKVGQVPNINV